MRININILTVSENVIHGLASALRATPRGMPNFEPAKPLESLEEG
jgi:hypothetical protein